jgi:hypothetical protein
VLPCRVVLLGAAPRRHRFRNCCRRDFRYRLATLPCPLENTFRSLLFGIGFFFRLLEPYRFAFAHDLVYTSPSRTLDTSNAGFYKSLIYIFIFSFVARTCPAHSVAGADFQCLHTFPREKKWSSRWPR